MQRLPEPDGPIVPVQAAGHSGLISGCALHAVEKHAQGLVAVSFQHRWYVLEDVLPPKHFPILDVADGRVVEAVYPETYCIGQVEPIVFVLAGIIEPHHVRAESLWNGDIRVNVVATSAAEHGTSK
eukprot:CAMPEP_0180485606 /NCGR_PEP_ID=MMETSP1036_2-20121128/36559_1 /TAXON_ID=632150 /ORGANISM="Azadinium spinosum, Strain 3D9" /LENGTH=125 /DNA_ID=CAMNT_0022493519 /DNA_START=219 /DNA_END=593 /DNA_ORIENTATION=+